MIIYSIRNYKTPRKQNLSSWVIGYYSTSSVWHCCQYLTIYGFSRVAYEWIPWIRAINYNYTVVILVVQDKTRRIIVYKTNDT